MSEKLTLADAMKYPNSKIKVGDGYLFYNVETYIEDRDEYKKHDLIENCQLILRSIDDLTDKEKKYIANKFLFQGKSLKVVGNITLEHLIVCCQTDMIKDLIDYLRSINILVEREDWFKSGKAVKA